MSKNQHGLRNYSSPQSVSVKMSENQRDFKNFPSCKSLKRLSDKKSNSQRDGILSRFLGIRLQQKHDLSPKRDLTRVQNESLINV